MSSTMPRRGKLTVVAARRARANQVSSL
ncbi:MAG: hypothetical protein JWN53_18, partial [Gemmatimonadetes bacterium]|nr:hypothetical protein [Gemmatimonadota bacterium]